MPSPASPTGPKQTAKPSPSVNVNFVQGGKPIKTVTVKKDCCLDKKGAKK